MKRLIAMAILSFTVASMAACTYNNEFEVVGTIDGYNIVIIPLEPDDDGHIGCQEWSYQTMFIKDGYEYIYLNQCLEHEYTHYVFVEGENIEFTQYIYQFNPSENELIASGVLIKREVE